MWHVERFGVNFTLPNVFRLSTDSLTHSRHGGGVKRRGSWMELELWDCLRKARTVLQGQHHPEKKEQALWKHGRTRCTLPAHLSRILHFCRINWSMNSLCSDSTLDKASYSIRYLKHANRKGSVTKHVTLKLSPVIFRGRVVFKLPLNIVQTSTVLDMWCPDTRSVYLSSCIFFSAMRAWSCCCWASRCFATDFSRFLAPIAWRTRRLDGYGCHNTSLWWSNASAYCRINLKQLSSIAETSPNARVSWVLYEDYHVLHSSFKR